MAQTLAPTSDFVTALRRLAATPCLLSGRFAAGPAGRRGMIATAVTALSATPPSLLVSLDRTRSLHPLLRQDARFCVNLLDARHAELCGVFAGAQTQADRFGWGDWADDPHGTPYLAGATALFCRVEATLDYATHTVVIAPVERVAHATGGGLIAYADGAVQGLSPLSGVRSG